jgi:hypothetical protein
MQTTETTDRTARQRIIDALYRFASQRPGLEFGNYGDWKAYRAEMRSITKDLHEARALLRRIELSGMSADTLRGGFRAYSGRLTLTETDGGVRLSYCTGQYWPTEYRRAVCAVAAAALWDYYRDNAPVDAGPIETHSNLQNVGDYIRRTARREFGRGIASRWFI